MIKKIIYIAIILGVGAAIYIYYEYTRKVATASERSTDFTMTADELVNAFSDEAAATKKFMEKTIEVSGTIEAVTKNEKSYDVSLSTDDPMTLITVQLAPEEKTSAQKLKPGDKVTLKGICNGKLSDIELNKGTIIK